MARHGVAGTCGAWPSVRPTLCSWSSHCSREAYMTPVFRRLAFINWLSAITLAQIAQSQQVPSNPPPDKRFKADILVVAPHPDDESTIAGYLAKAVLDEHRHVAVVLTTRGD